MIEEEPINPLRPIDALQNTKPENDSINTSNGHVVELMSLEEESRDYSLKENIKLTYERLMKSKVPTCLLILFYIFICLFGNVVTGIFLLKHHFDESEIESKTRNITIGLYENNTCKDNCNTTIGTPVITNLTIGDTDDLSYLLSYDLALNMSQFDEFHVEVRKQLSYVSRMIFSRNIF